MVICWHLGAFSYLQNLHFTDANSRYNTSHGVKSSESPNLRSTDRVGPTITSTIDMRNKTGNPLDGYVVQDGVVPKVLSKFVATVLCAHATFSSSSKASIRQGMKRMLSRYKQRLLHPLSLTSTTRGAQVFLIMSHDSKLLAIPMRDQLLNINRQPGDSSAR